jgi:predicted ribosomally synthesized peptide with SipW-like signal peptide
MLKARKNAKRLLTLGLALGLLAVGVFAAFTATTTSAGNSITSGSVKIEKDVAGAIYSITGGKPGQVDDRCVTVTYTGTLAATVKLYASAAVTNGAKYNLQIDRGTRTGGGGTDCGTFTVTGNVRADAPMTTLPTTYAGGYDIKGGAFAQNDAVLLRFRITHNDDTTPNGNTTESGTGLHDWTFEARNN